MWEANTRCFLELVRKKQYTAEQLDVKPDYFKNFSEANPQVIQLIGLKHINLKKASKKIADALWEKDTGWNFQGRDQKEFGNFGIRQLCPSSQSYTVFYFTVNNQYSCFDFGNCKKLKCLR